MSSAPHDSYESRSTFGMVGLVAVVVICGGALLYGPRFLSSQGKAVDDGGGVEETEELQTLNVLNQPPEETGLVEVTVEPESADQILKSLGIGVTKVRPSVGSHTG